MQKSIQHAAVLGAGTMGAAIAALLANAGIPVTLFDIVPTSLSADQEKAGLTLADKAVRDSIVKRGLEQMLKSRPAALTSPARARLINTANLEDDFDKLRQADWIIEAIVENLDVKRKWMARLDEVRAAHAIVSTNTSGIPVAAICKGLSEGFRQHFLGTHFFNPPRYLKLLEIIPTADTLPELTDFISRFCETRLGKGIVLCKDTPNFIGNRLLSGSISFTLDYALEHGYTIDEVDALTGPLIGRPKTATYRLLDLIGIDVMQHVNDNLAPAIPHDTAILPYLKSTRVNDLLHSMIERKWLGNKTKTGFYKTVSGPDGKKEFWSLDLKTLAHKAPEKPQFAALSKTKSAASLGERLHILLADQERAGALVQALLYQGFAYAASLLPEIADTPKPVDDAMRWGFAHESGPFEQWDALGVAETAAAMQKAGFPAAAWVSDMLKNGNPSFYKYDGDRKTAVYNPLKKAYEPIPHPPGIILLKDEKEAGKVIRQNDGASLIDLGDGIACLELHTKMNTLDEDIITLANTALDLLATDYEGLVVGSQAENFSAGANIFLILLAAKQGMWDSLADMIRKLQDLHMRMRYSTKPVVAAPAGLALGGGAELMMHAGRCVAFSELYAGLVEAGVGVIPAGGGTKEMVRRLVTPAMLTPEASALPFLQRAFMQVGNAKVSTSADEALEMGLLNEADRIIFDREEGIAQAKREALHMAAGGYRPPLPARLYAAGRDALATLRVGIFTFKEARQISAYDAVVGEKLAYVLCGGELSAPAWVDEQYFLDLEREAFLSLCGEERTQARLAHMLDTGKPLRN